MFAEIITIGDELLIGQVVDTNSAWMGQELNKIGIEVLRIVSIRDREEEIMEAVDNAMKRVNIVLVTGGLGPTKDDITKQTLCKYFHTELIFSEEVFENVKRVLAGKIPMNALNKSQAMVPKDCTVINNPVGSASVSWFEKEGKVLVSMPGVPQEMDGCNHAPDVSSAALSRIRTCRKAGTMGNSPAGKHQAGISAQTWHYPPAADRTRTKEIRSRKRTESRTSQTGSDTRR